MVLLMYLMLVKKALCWFHVSKNIDTQLNAIKDKKVKSNKIKTRY